MVSSFLALLYRSSLGRLLSYAARPLTWLHAPRMLYGVTDPKTGTFRKYSRISSSVVVVHRQHLSLSDHVWVWHHSILDATEGLSIEEGAQIGAWVGIFTHGSERAIRLLGQRFVHVPAAVRPGYTRGSVRIGAFTFIGAGAVVLPGVSIGKGSLIGAGAVVSKSVPERSVVVGNPGRIVGNTKDLDRKLLVDLGFPETYYDPLVLNELRAEARVASQAKPISSDGKRGAHE